MTVSSSLSTQTFSCNGSTTVFTCPFRVLEASEVRGFLITISTGASAELVNGADFVVTGVGAANAVATTTTAYSSLYQINFRRRTQRLQPTDYGNNDPFPAESHENALDRLTHIVQEQDTDIGRALLAPEPETGITLPSLSSRASKMLAFSATGVPEATSFTATQVASAVAAAYAAGSTADAVTFLPFGTGAVSRSVQDKLRETVSLPDFNFLPGSTAPIKAANSLALADAIASFSEQSTASLDGSTYSNAGRLNLPPGSDWFGSRLRLTRNVHMLGASTPDGNSFGATRLIFPDAGGIVLDAAETSGTTGSDGATLEKLSVVPAAYAAAGATPLPVVGADGLRVHVRSRLRDMQPSGWAGNGVSIIASAGSGATLGGNANSWSLQDLRLQQNGMHGLYVQGADANAGVAIRIDSSSNRRCGIYDDSFLGNTYVGCHTASNGKDSQVSYLSGRYYAKSDTLGGSTTPGSNEAVWKTVSNGKVSHGGSRYVCISDAANPSTTTPGTNPAVWSLIGAGGVAAPEFPAWVSGGAYHIDGTSATHPEWVSGGAYYIGYAYRSDGLNARSVFLGCYSEGGQPPSCIMHPSWVVGGLHGAGFDPDTTAGMLTDSGFLAPSTVSGVTRPTYSWTQDQGTGLFLIGTASGRFGLSSLGSPKAQFGPGGIKTSTDGAYYNQTQDATEFVQTAAGVHTSMHYAKTASYTGPGIWSKADTASGTGFNLITAAHLGGTCFQVLGNGNVQNTSNSYGAISDAKLKDNVVDADKAAAWGKFAQYRFVTYTLKDSPEAGTMLGLVAQEVEQVSPSLVYSTPDFAEVEVQVGGETAVERRSAGTSTKGVKYSVISLMAHVALQEAMRRIEDLEARLAALEAP